MSVHGFRVREAGWEADRTALAAVRREVFIVEQRIPENLEWDEIDPHCRHALALDRAGVPIGTGRLLPDGHIGRMAVVAAWRGRGVGSALLLHLIAVARARGDRAVVLNAQVQALPFYARHGFTVFGAIYDDAGIAHRAMHLELAPGLSPRP